MPKTSSKHGWGASRTATQISRERESMHTPTDKYTCAKQISSLKSFYICRQNKTSYKIS